MTRKRGIALDKNLWTIFNKIFEKMGILKKLWRKIRKWKAVEQNYKNWSKKCGIELKKVDYEGIHWVKIWVYSGKNQGGT